MTKTVQLIYPLDNQGRAAKGPTAAACSKNSLGTIPLPKQTKTEVDWGCRPFPCTTTRCRDAWTTAYATICGPEDIVSGLVNDVTECVKVGVVAAGLSAIFAGPGAATPAFEAAFKGCLFNKIGDRVSELSVSLSAEEETADWGAC